jgi:hypothetical protein
MLEYIIPDLQQTRLPLKVEKNVAELCIYLTEALPSCRSCVTMCLVRPGLNPGPAPVKISLDWAIAMIIAIYFRAGSGLIKSGKNYC